MNDIINIDINKIKYLGSYHGNSMYNFFYYEGYMLCMFFNDYIDYDLHINIHNLDINNASANIIIPQESFEVFKNLMDYFNYYNIDDNQIHTNEKGVSKSAKKIHSIFKRKDKIKKLLS